MTLQIELDYLLALEKGLRLEKDLERQRDSELERARRLEQDLERQRDELEKVGRLEKDLERQSDELEKDLRLREDGVRERHHRLERDREFERWFGFQEQTSPFTNPTPETPHEIANTEMADAEIMRPDESSNAFSSPGPHHRDSATAADESWDLEIWLDNIAPFPHKTLALGLHALTMSRSTAADTPSFASEGEASFVLGEEPLPSRDRDRSPDFAAYLAKLAEAVVDGYFCHQASAVSDAGGSASSSPSRSSHQAHLPNTAPTSSSGPQDSNQTSELKRWRSLDDV